MLPLDVLHLPPAGLAVFVLLVTAGAVGGFITVMVPDLHQPTDEICSLATRVCASHHEVRELLQAGSCRAVFSPCYTSHSCAKSTCGLPAGVFKT